MHPLSTTSHPVTLLFLSGYSCPHAGTIQPLPCPPGSWDPTPRQTESPKCNGSACSADGLREVHQAQESTHSAGALQCQLCPAGDSPPPFFFALYWFVYPHSTWGSQWTGFIWCHVDSAIQVSVQCLKECTETRSKSSFVVQRKACFVTTPGLCNSLLQEWTLSVGFSVPSEDMLITTGLKSIWQICFGFSSAAPLAFSNLLWLLNCYFCYQHFAIKKQSCD